MTEFTLPKNSKIKRGKETAAEFFKRRAAGGKAKDFKSVLRRVRNVPPMPGDELPTR